MRLLGEPDLEVANREAECWTARRIKVLGLCTAGFET